MDLDSDILAMIDGYVSSALGATGTKKAVIHKPVEAFEGDTIPDVMSLLPLPQPPPEPLPRDRAPRSSVAPIERGIEIELDDETTAVNVRRSDMGIRIKKP